MTSTYEKARALFLSALMVVSVFGATVAFAGAGAAQTSQGFDQSYYQDDVDATITVEDNSANGETDTTESVEVTVTSPSGSTDDSETVTLTETGQDTGVFQGTVTTTATDSANTENGFIEAESGTTITATYDSGQIGTATIDGNSPALSAATPADGDTVSSTDAKIQLDLTDNSETGVSAENTDVVMTASGDTNPFIDGVVANTDGMDISGGQLIIDPGTGELVELPDNTQVDVTVTTEDKAGNEATVSYTFTVNTESASLSLNAPTDADGNAAPVSDAAPTFEVSVEDGSANEKVEKSSVSVTLTDHEGNIVIDGVSPSDSDSDGVEYVDNGDGVDDLIRVTPGSDLVDGDATLNVQADTVSVSDDSTNNINEDFSVKVDTTKPTVDTISLTGAPIDDDEAGQTAGVQVTFDDSGVGMDTESNPTVTLTGLAQETSTPLTYDSDDGWEGDILLPDTDETATATLEVTGGQDDVGNALAETSNTQDVEFYTDEPSFANNFVDDANGFPVIKGTVNIETKLTAQNADGNAVTYEIKEEGEDDSEYETLTLDSGSVDTTTLSEIGDISESEGTKTIRATVNDGDGNTVMATQQVVVDNVDPSVSVTSEYQPDDDGTPFTDAGTISLSDVFNVQNDDNNGATYEYAVYDAETDSYGSYQSISEGTLDTTLLSDTQIRLKATVTEDGNADQATNTVDVQVDNEGNSEGVYATDANDDGTVDVVVKSPNELNSLEVTVEDNNHFAGGTQTLTLADDFQSESEDDLTRYYTTIDVPLDGEYDVAVESADNGLESTETSVTGDDTTVTVDTTAPSIVDANLIGSDGASTMVRVEFDEPVTIDDTDGFSFNGSTTVHEVYPDTADEGYVNIRLNEETQTTNNESIKAEADSDEGTATFSEDFGDSTDNVDNDAADVTFSLGLSKGLNVVSVPAETGSVSLDSLDLSGVDTVMKYEDGEWLTYDANGDLAEFESLTGGEGYIVNATQATELDVEVENVPATQQAAINSEGLENGWNLVGAFQEGSQSVDQAFSPFPSTTTWTAELGYTGTTVDTLDGGEGYWVFVNDGDAIHTRVPYTGLTSEKPDVANVVVTDNGDSDDTVTTDDTVSVSADVRDDNAVSTVTVDASVLGGSSDLTLTTDGNNVYDAEFDVGSSGAVAESDGTYSLPVAAIDSHGNVETGKDSVTLDTTVETTGVTVTNPESQDVKVVVTADEQLSDLSATDDTTTVSGVGSDFTESESGGTYTYTAEYDAATDGLVTVTVGSASDTNGNTDTSTGLSDSTTIDTTSPTLDSVSKNSDTELSVTIADNIDVDESTISASDFSLSEGTVDSISTSGSGTDATVTLTLQSAVDSSSVDVSIASGETIADDAGNQLTDTAASVTAADMDGVAPTLDGATKTAPDTIEVTISDGVDVDETTITASDFSLGSGSVDTISKSDSGTDATVTLTLKSAVDSSSVDVSIASGESIDDTSGNSLTSGTVTTSASS